ncbi:hypothetical protein [Actinophytocola sp. NPDC049390]|uniref:hypothetical protein n=1 Tax=Actinophytocola sp. NPDC049390 TaxID=3363894 RepID=UPI0037A96E51
MVEEWRRVESAGGNSFPVRRDSPLDAAFPEATAPTSDVPMTWSLGRLGDLMWMRLPEARPLLAKLITSELEHAMNARSELMLLVGDIVTDALWRPLMCPTLDDYPRTRDQVARQFQVVREGYLADHPDQDATREMLVDYVFYNLQEPKYLAIVEEVDPELAALIQSVMG